MIQLKTKKINTLINSASGNPKTSQSMETISISLSPGNNGVPKSNSANTHPILQVSISIP